MHSQSFECLLQDPSKKSSLTKAQTPKLIAVNPLEIIFEQSRERIDKNLELKNVYPCRMAFRIKCNGPTRYVVQPKMGFIAVGDKVSIKISLIDGSKYQSNHAFIIQAMPAPGEFADRKLIWNQPNVLGILTNTRVRTMRPSNGNGSPPLHHHHPHSSTSPAISSTSTSSGLGDGSSNPSEPLDHGEFSSKVDELAEQLQKAMNHKEDLAKQMILVVNEIKSMEVELDRNTQMVNELSERIRNGEIQYSNLVLTENTLKADLEQRKSNPQPPPSPRLQFHSPK